MRHRLRPERAHRWSVSSTPTFVLVLVLVLAALGLSSCGGASTTPEEGATVETAHADDVFREDSHEDTHGDEHATEAGSTVRLTPEARVAAEIETAAAVRRDVGAWIQVTGTLSYDERRLAIATARIGGRVARVVADYGETVTEGQPLAWIDSPELGAAQAELLRARSSAELHRAEYERAQLLAEGGALSRGELLRREAEWRAARADVQAAEQKLHILGLSQSDIAGLDDSTAEADHVYPVRAGVSGRVTERSAVVGQVVAPEDELFRVADLDTLWLFLQVFEKDLPVIDEGATVTLTCESHPEDRFRGTVDFVGQVLDPHSRTVQVRAVIDNPERKLRPGMFVYASVDAPSRGAAGPPRLAVPVTAVTQIDRRDVVFVEQDELAFEARPVVVGRRGSELVEVVSGLEEGERIALSGVFVLKSELLSGSLQEHHH